MGSYLSLSAITKSFNGVQVINDLSIQAERGELLTLLGPSGCGKSTLLRCIAGLAEMDQGSIELDGVELTSLPAKKRDVGMVFQSYALFPNMTVYDNIAFGLKMRGDRREQIKGRVEEMLELVDLSDKRKDYPHRLSGGQQQRVALARSLAVEPKLMLLDEPLSALDAKIRRNLRMELRRIQQRLGMTMIFVTHDQEEALMISDRVCIMHEGRIIQTGRPEDIYAEPNSSFVARFIGHYNVLDRQEMEAVFGVRELAGSTYAIRPESVKLTPADEAAPHPAEAYRDSLGKSTALIAQGKVTEITVLGSLIRCAVNAGGTEINADMLNDGSCFPIRQGSEVVLAVDPQNCRNLDHGGAIGHCPSYQKNERFISLSGSRATAR
ncbi:ABC transporter ATP-binding protein [Paenibacillus sambharensis]|uniref:Carnitine transport ATP-binding protein OpuCA n=1 Tax=Paenibacillus sambharensis TaxID=1803190 RepID=A0A2W1LZY4_9BACL|nr:ABC transporter ATP-binding protein [Paenibacillus sambharensis]PZD97047.1 ABC transporter ATP-binding protein [Paenibacillus sambharensis]